MVLLIIHIPTCYSDT